MEARAGQLAEAFFAGRFEEDPVALIICRVTGEEITGAGEASDGLVDLHPRMKGEEEFAGHAGTNDDSRIVSDDVVVKESELGAFIERDCLGPEDGQAEESGKEDEQNAWHAGISAGERRGVNGEVEEDRCLLRRAGGFWH